MWDGREMSAPRVLSGFGHYDFELKLALGVRVVHNAYHDWFADDKKCLAIDFDLSNYGWQHCPAVVTRGHVEIADFRPDGQSQFVSMLSKLRPETRTNIQVLILNRRAHIGG